MKNVLTLCASLFVMQIGYAQSNLVLSSETGDAFWIKINEIQQNYEPQRNLKVTGVPNGAIKLLVMLEDESEPILKKSLFLDNSVQVNLIVTNGGNNSKSIRLLGETPIKSMGSESSSQYVMAYSSTPQNVTITSTTQTTTTSGGMDDDNVSMGMNINGMGLNMSININDGEGTSNSTVSSTTTTTTTTTSSSSTYSNYGGGSVATTESIPVDNEVEEDNSGTYGTGYNGASNCNSPMSETDFTSALRSIKSKEFEDSKTSAARQITKSKCLLSDQVKRIMEAFEFEEDRLDFAVFAYKHTYDLDNYYVVNDAFEYELTADDLREQIGEDSDDDF